MRMGRLVPYCLVKLQDRLFLDIWPDKFPSGEQDPNGMEFVHNAPFFLPVHTFMRVNPVGDQFRIRPTDDYGFEKLIKVEPKAVKYDTLYERPILTASTAELQAFLTKYADDDRLFMYEIPLIRRASSAAK